MASALTSVQKELKDLDHRIRQVKDNLRGLKHRRAVYLTAIRLLQQPEKKVVRLVRHQRQARNGNHINWDYIVARMPHSFNIDELVKKAHVMTGYKGTTVRPRARTYMARLVKSGGIHRTKVGSYSKLALIPAVN